MAGVDQTHVEQLKRNVIFRFLGEESLARLLGAARVETFSEGQRIITEGETSEDLFLVLDGSVNVMVQEDDREVFICAIGGGDLFGEAGIFINMKRTAHVLAAAPTTIARIGRKALLSFVHTDPANGVKLLMLIIYNLLRKLRGANQELAYERKSDIDQDDIDAIVAGLQ